MGSSMVPPRIKQKNVIWVWGEVDALPDHFQLIEISLDGCGV
jgi:hypothetical protein